MGVIAVGRGFYLVVMYSTSGGLVEPSVAAPPAQSRTRTRVKPVQFLKKIIIKKIKTETVH